MEAKGSSPTFTADTIPDALLNDHSLAANRWGLLHLHEGEVVFIDLATGTEHTMTAPNELVIRPETPHKLRLAGPFKLHIDFYRAPREDG